VTRPDVEVAIVGAGATGLFLGARLATHGVAVRLLEARREPTRHSRAIGVHPPGLRALTAVGAAEPLIERGVRVRRGHAFAGDRRGRVRRLGTLDFGATLPDPHRFVLTVPQHVTERVLEERLAELAPDALRRGVRVAGWDDDGAGVTLRLAPHGGGDAELRAALVVDASGSGGGAADRVGLPVAGGRYGDAYLMADLLDDGALGDDAAIYLSAAGVVEAFPLPGGLRRWVAKTDGLRTPPDPAELARLVEARVGVRLDPTRATMASAFGVERRLARRLHRGRAWLCGDAAHVVAPLGGQGMTLGWLGAETLADQLMDWRAGVLDLNEAAARYDATQRRRAQRAIARGAWNLRLGRATALGPMRALLVRALLTPPLAGRMARVFTMQA
jgi:2-polyprenyl-6-methoxyphenol hydroxylase-like FAD-dependent oxidoreductase